jgi:hypothetical protein
MVRSALFARVSNHETAYAAILRDAAKWPLLRMRTTFPFIIFVDAIFTTLFEQPFTNVLDVTGAKPAISCLCRAGNAN